MLTGATNPGSLLVGVEGLRNERGMVRICLTSNRTHFPDCHNDPHARRVNVPAAQAANLHIEGLGAGTYAIAAMHDENGNGRLDTFLGIPREGFGFSGNPRIRFSAPSFEQVRFQMPPSGGTQTIRLRYFT